MQPQTLYEKIWQSHLVHSAEGEPDLLYVDFHLVHEVTSPQAFAGLQLSGRKIRRPERTMAVPDHNVPTVNREGEWSDPISRLQVDTLRQNVLGAGIEYFFDIDDDRQGIVHVVGPEQGFTHPGSILVCGDSHTATHGAFGALAFGIGTSEVEHVLATQTLQQVRVKTCAVTVEGTLPFGVTAKDLILVIIRELGTSGGAGHVLEYRGATIAGLSMEGRMTICNMSIEAGARAGMIAPDEKTFAYLKGKAGAPSGPAWDAAVDRWRCLPSDLGASFDKEVQIVADTLAPMVTWGTTPAQSASIDQSVPKPIDGADSGESAAITQALDYMGIEPGIPITDIRPDVVFIGSCTNSRIEDLRVAAEVARGKKVADSLHYAIVVPGSGLVKRQAEEEGLDRIFTEAGFEWRDPGCSMCLAMNGDQLRPGERAASTSNRNFQGRQGPRGRTHLMSPAMAAAAAISGHFVDVRDL